MDEAATATATKMTQIAAGSLALAQQINDGITEEASRLFPNDGSDRIERLERVVGDMFANLERLRAAFLLHNESITAQRQHSEDQEARITRLELRLRKIQGELNLHRMHSR